MMLMLVMMMIVPWILGFKRKRSISDEPGLSGGVKGAAEDHSSSRSSSSGSINEKDIWRRLREVGLDEETLNKKHKAASIAHITKLETEQNLKSPEIRDSKQLFQKLKAALEEAKSHILKDQMQLEAALAKTKELKALQVKLEEEIKIFRAQQQKLLEETDALNQEKQMFEKEWEILDEKKEQLRQELEEVEVEKKRIKEGEEQLMQEKAMFWEEHAHDIASLQLEKEAFERYRQHQEVELFAKVKREQDNLLRDIELRRSEMEASLEKRREELEKRSDRISLSGKNVCDINATEVEQRCSPRIHKKKRQQHSTNGPLSEDNKGKSRRYNFRDTTMT